MKRIITFLALAIFTLALSAGVSAQNKKKSQNLQEVTFVTTIDCKNCVKKVEANLPYEKGIKDMNVTLEDKTIWIKYDAYKTDKEKLAEAIRKLGYEAEEKVAETPVKE